MRISQEPIWQQLNSKLKRTILELLFYNQLPVSERQLARIIGVSNVAVNKAMKQLLEFNMVKANSVGTAMVWEINEKSFAYPYVKAMVEEAKISPLEFVKKSIRETISEYGKPGKSGSVRNIAVKSQITDAYIFGSTANGTGTPDSDIDVLIVTENGARKETLKNDLETRIGMKILEGTGNRVSFHVYSNKSIKKNQPSWLHDAVSMGIRV